MNATRATMLALFATSIAIAATLDAATPKHKPAPPPAGSEQQCKAMKDKAKAAACLKRIEGYKRDAEVGNKAAVLADAIITARGPRVMPMAAVAGGTLSCGQSVTITAPTTCGSGGPPPVNCTGGSVVVGDHCECPPGYTWNSTNTACVALPPPTTGCGGFTRTIEVTFAWPAGGRLYSGPMGVNDVFVGKFTTGNTDSSDNNLPRVSGAEWQSPPSARFAVLSATKCDFSAQTWQGATTAGNSVQVPFAVGAGSNWAYYPKLLKNTTYYFNVKNLSTTESCSNQGVCNMFIELSVPGS